MISRPSESLKKFRVTKTLRFDFILVKLHFNINRNSALQQIIIIIKIVTMTDV